MSHHAMLLKRPNKDFQSIGHKVKEAKDKIFSGGTYGQVR